MKGVRDILKRIAAVAGGVLMAFGMWSCESTGDEWKDMPDSYRVDYGEVVMVRSAGRNECLIRRDDNLILRVQRNLVENAVVDHGDRVLVNYFIMGDMTADLPELGEIRGGYDIQLNNLIRIPCQDVELRNDITDTEYGSMSFDPLVVTHINVGSHHIDMAIDYYRSASVEHEFGLLCERSDENGDLTLRVVHDAGMDGETVVGSLVKDYRISFDVSKLLTDKSQAVRIVWVEYGNRPKETLVILPAA